MSELKFTVKEKEVVTVTTTKKEAVDTIVLTLTPLEAMTILALTGIVGGNKCREQTGSIYNQLNDFFRTRGFNYLNHYTNTINGYAEFLKDEFQLKELIKDV